MSYGSEMLELAKRTQKRNQKLEKSINKKIADTYMTSMATKIYNAYNAALKTLAHSAARAGQTEMSLDYFNDASRRPVLSY